MGILPCGKLLRGFSKIQWSAAQRLHHDHQTKPRVFNEPNIHSKMRNCWNPQRDNASYHKEFKITWHIIRNFILVLSFQKHKRIPRHVRQSLHWQKVSSQNTRTFGQCCPRAWPPLLDKKRPACQVCTRCHPICTANQSHWMSANPYITLYITSDVSPYLVFISISHLTHYWMVVPP